MHLWNARNGELIRIYAVSSGIQNTGHAVWEPANNHLIETSGDIWRTLAWVGRKSDGWPARFPLESFGPLPELDRSG